MTAQPTGTVTLLFSDIEGSTRLLELLGTGRYAQALDRHRRLLRRAFAAHAGYEVNCEGDAFFVAFADAEDAVAAALTAQQALAAAAWPDGQPLRVRMGVHSGDPLPAPPKYVGLDVHRAARIMAAAHGGQVLVSEDTRRLLAGDDRFSFRDLGDHRLKDLPRPQRLHQLLIEGLPDAFPPLRTLGGRPGELPVQPNRLIGRARELAEVEALLAGGIRLLTLTGPGGTGKTRLALQVAGDLLDGFPDGVFFVPLAAVRDPELVPAAAAQTLGIRAYGTMPLAQALELQLGPQRLLLLLDNFEQVVDAAPEVTRLLGAAPGLTVLVTSREPLRVTGEQVYPVPPLGVPETGRHVTPSAAAAHDAVALFVERARAVRPDFALTEANVAAVTAICAHVGGLPLAVELAAARVRALSPQAIRARLDRSLALLTGGARDADERQQTLRATIDWSYGLLGRPEQAMLARLSVFAGGCRLEGAEAVCDPGGPAGVDVLDTLTALVDKHLVRQRDDADGEPRYRMDETIREYAAQKLQASPDPRLVLDRRDRYYAGLAETAHEQLHGPRQLEWFALLDAEHENLRSVVMRSAAGDGEAALRILAAAWSFFERRGDSADLLRLFDEVLRDSRQAPDRTRASALFAFARLLFRRGEGEAARGPLSESLALAERVGDTAGVARACAALGWIATDGAEALRLCVRALEAARTAGEPWLIADALNNLGCARIDRGEYDAARADLSEALAIRERIGDLEGQFACAMNLGNIDLTEGRRAAARARYLRGLEAASARGDEWGLAGAHERLAALARAEGDPAALERHLRQASEIADRGGFVTIQAALAELGSGLGGGDARETTTTVGRLVGGP